MFDFQKLSNIFLSQSGTAGTFMKWPESGGDTAVLKRINKEQLQPYSASSPNQSNIYLIPGGGGPAQYGSIESYGDTNSYRSYSIQAYTFLKLVTSQIQSISLIQERIPDWYKNQQLQTPYGWQPFGGAKF